MEVNAAMKRLSLALAILALAIAGTSRKAYAVNCPILEGPPPYNVCAPTGYLCDNGTGCEYKCDNGTFCWSVNPD